MAAKKTNKTRSGSYQNIKVNSESEFSYRESYNHLRTNVMFSLAALDTDKKTLVVTSSYPSEGKSSVSSNLAISLARLQKKVLLIDADLRKPTIHRIFEIANKSGLTDILLGNTDATGTINRFEDLNLDVITAGTIPPNPSELLGSKAMSSLIEKLEKVYDYVIIDTPPVLVVSDALMLSKSVAGALVSCRYNQTKYSNLSNLLSAFEFADMKVLGITVVGSKESGGAYERLSGYSERKSE